MTDMKSCLCGARFYPRANGSPLCRQCAQIAAPWYTCERCDRDTQMPLTECREELVCGRCLLRDPDPTPEEIAAACAEIRAEWSEEQLMHAKRGLSRD